MKLHAWMNYKNKTHDMGSLEHWMKYFGKEIQISTPLFLRKGKCSELENVLNYLLWMLNVQFSV